MISDLVGLVRDGEVVVNVRLWDLISDLSETGPRDQVWLGTHATLAAATALERCEGDE